MAIDETVSQNREHGQRLLLVLLGVAAAYFVLAKLGLLVAQVHPNATPIWPPAGFALAILLVWGPKMLPAIFVGALAANDTTAGSFLTSTSIAVGNTLEAFSAFWLLKEYSDGRKTFDTPVGVARFAAASVFVGAPVSATIGVTSLFLGGFTTIQAFPSVWTTWWLGNIAGVLVICPAIVLWTEVIRNKEIQFPRFEAGVAIATTIIVGLCAFSPLIEQSPQRSSIAFLAIVPLLWSSLRLGPTITATVSVILVAFAVWGTLAGSGPFGTGSLNEALLNLLSFMVSASIPSLALSAELLRRTRHNKLLDDKIHERTGALNAAADTIRQQSTEREVTRQQLIEQAIHLREAQRIANLGSWSWEVPSNKVIWSDQLFAIYGIAITEFDATFESYLAKIHPDDRTRVQSVIHQGLEGGSSFQTEERIVRPDGEIRYLRTSGEVLRDALGAPIRMLGICADITEERQGAARLASAQEQLVHFQKLEALGKLTGGVAHDFNNLLMIVGGSAEFLRKRILDEKLIPKLDAIRMATDRGTALTRQLLTFSRQQVLHPSVIDLAIHLRGLSDILNSSLRGNIQLKIEPARDVWTVKVDPAQLELCILNFAVNARDAMPAGGTFCITTDNLHLDGEFQDLNGDFVAIRFEDTGIGIAPEYRQKIFDPFFTTKASGTGTGLGLSQAYGFARASGGGITVESKPGRTIFTLYLPRTTKEPAATQDKSLPATESEGGAALVVDDNAGVAQVTAEMLEELGYIVEIAESGEKAIELLRNGLAFNLVVTDVVMPGEIDGVALANLIREQFPELAVVVVTGYTQSLSQLSEERAVVKKPFTEKDLREAIELAKIASTSTRL